MVYAKTIAAVFSDRLNLSKCDVHITFMPRYGGQDAAILTDVGL